MAEAWLMLLSPIAAAAICYVIFRYVAAGRHIDRRAAADDLAGFLFFGIMLGLLAGVAAPLVWLFGYSSQIAPALIILTVPVGIAIGTVVSAIIWGVSATDA